MLSALVVDRDPTARRQVAQLLQLGGWEVHQAAEASEALCLATVWDLDLVVTDSAVPGASAAELFGQLRRVGCTARFLVVTAWVTDQLRTDAAAAGALACLAKPISAGLVLDLLRRRSTGPADQPAHPGTATAGDRTDVAVDDDEADALAGDDELRDRLQGMYEQALPTRLTAITSSVAQGDSPAVAAAAHTLAGTSSQLGHPDVAEICQAIAADARRGILAHHLVADLAELALAAEAAAGRVSAEQRKARLALIQAARP
jgi:CheY-like chemotaxis protein